MQTSLVQSEKSAWELQAQKEEERHSQRINQVKMRIYQIVQQKSRNKAVRRIAADIGNFLDEEYEDLLFDISARGKDWAARFVLKKRGEQLKAVYLNEWWWKRWFSKGSGAVREFIRITKTQ